LLKINNLRKEYNVGNNKIIAVNNVSVIFDDGKLYAIMGHSGSGKSTFIHCCGLLENYDEGSIIIDGKNVNKLSSKEKANIRNKNIGFVFQSFYLSPKLKSYENVMLPMYLNKGLSGNDRKKRAFELLKQFDLKDRVNHYPKQLSGGEQQRVAIARALANDPKIILADEPTGNLDADNEKFVLEALRKLANSGKCVIVVTHNQIIKNYADKVMYMNDGRLSENNE